MEAHEQLAARHIALRERAGLTQEQEAKLAGVSPTTISGIESGKITRPHLKTLLKLARALGAAVGELRESGKVEAPSSQDKLFNNGVLEEERLIDRTEVQEWLRGEGHMTEDEFLEWAAALGKDANNGEELLDAIEAGRGELRVRQDALTDALRTPEARKALFPVPHGLSEEETKAWLLKPPGRWELKWEISQEYLDREVALVNYSRRLFVEGKTEDYLDLASKRDPQRHEEMREERRRVLEASLAKAKAA